MRAVSFFGEAGLFTTGAGPVGLAMLGEDPGGLAGNPPGLGGIVVGLTKGVPTAGAAPGLGGGRGDPRPPGVAEAGDFGAGGTAPSPGFGGNEIRTVSLLTSGLSPDKDGRAGNEILTVSFLGSGVSAIRMVG